MSTWTGVEAKALRQAMRLTVRDFAERELGVNVRTVTKWESRGSSITLLPDTQAIMDGALARASNEVKARFERIATTGLAVQDEDEPSHAAHQQNGRITGREAILNAVNDATPGSAFNLASVLDVLGTAGTIDTLGLFARSVVDRYELEGPQSLAFEVQSLRRLCRHLGERISTESERCRLTKVSAELAALLSYMSVNLSEFAAAETYALEAAVLATAINDLSLLAWIKGTQSLAAYYQRRYKEALAFARVGLQMADTDPQRIRLLSNGLARAAGKLGDRGTVDRALGEALELAHVQDRAPGMTSCIDFEPYGWARTAANAATAYLAVGDYARVLKLTRQLHAIVAESDSDWSRSLVSLDEATALALGSEADLEHAVAVGMNALAASAGKPIASIGKRAAEFAASLKYCGPNRASRDFHEALREWPNGTSEQLS